ARRPRRPKGEDLIEPPSIQGGYHFTRGEDRLDFRAKVKIASALRVEQRPNPEPVPRDEDRLPVAIVNCKSELPVQFAEQIDSPFSVAVSEDFGVAYRAEDVPFSLELSTQLRMIVDLAVAVNDDRTDLIR